MTHEEDLLHKRMKRLLKAAPDGRVEFKNYKDLCEKLKLPVKTGNSKKSQMKWLKCFFDLTENDFGHGLYFTQVYSDENINDFLLNRTIEPNSHYRPAYEISENKGIYGIYINDVLYYIGSSLNLQIRLHDHIKAIYSSNINKDDKYKVMQQLIKEGGQLSFKVFTSNINEVNQFNIEQQFIKNYKPPLNGTAGGYFHIMYTSRKQKLIKEYKHKISENDQLINQLKLENSQLQSKIKLLQSLNSNEDVDRIMNEITSGNAS